MSVFAAATALFLGASLADSRDGGAGTGLLLAAAGCFGVTVVAVVGLWMASGSTGDPAAERARVAEQIAEELHGPLVSLRSLSALGLRTAADMTEEDRAAFFALIDEEASRLRRIVEHLCIALRIEANGLRYDPHEEDLGALVEEAVLEIPHGDHPLHLELDAGLRVRVDRARLGEVLEAVVDNASRFSPPDAPIEVRAFRGQDRSVVLEIADHGPGIPIAHRLAVFRRGVTWRPPGYQETPGAGVGLFVARAHVLGHGGEIRIEDRSETQGDAEPGTVVRIDLPSVP